MKTHTPRTERLPWTPLRSSILIGVLWSAGVALAQTGTISLHPDNPHYFLWRGKAAVLIASGEHYGAVLNADFNYTAYLDTLARDGLNLTRTFTGAAYLEPVGAFKIERN